MTRGQFIERVITQIYGGKPTDDAEITINLVNLYLNDAVGAAVKQSYVESIKLDGVAYINNSFYSTFTDLDIAADNSEQYMYSVALPQVPYGLAKNEGISTLRFKKDNKISHTAIPLSSSQWAYRENFKRIPNKIMYCPEGDVLKIDSVIPLYAYKANVTMVSPGLSTDLTATLHVPAEFFPMITDYVRTQLAFERSQPKDGANDGTDIK